jgi:hypothetical protein
MAAPASPAALPQYYIADGCIERSRLAKNGLLILRARLVIQGQPDQFIDVGP